MILIAASIGMGIGIATGSTDRPTDAELLSETANENVKLKNIRVVVADDESIWTRRRADRTSGGLTFAPFGRILRYHTTRADDFFVFGAVF